MSFITVDLDSTLYDTMHRHHMIDRVNGTDWNKYSAACVDDAVIEGMRQLVWMAVDAQVRVHFVSGRMESARQVTEAKLVQDGMEWDGLWLDDTASGDHVTEYGSHALYKVARIQHVIKEVNDIHLFHVDDYVSVAVELAKVGIPCICVRPPHELVADAEGVLA